MKKSITFNAIPASGVHERVDFYWNGHEFIDTCKVKLPANIIESQEQKAMAWLEKYMPLVAYMPSAYNFRIV